MPQARHGARGVLSFAVLGSKLDGTGFENEHIGHIQHDLVWDIDLAAWNLADYLGSNNQVSGS